MGKDGTPHQKESAIQESMDKLNDAYCGIMKAQKAASALQGRAEQMLDESSQKFKVAFEGMLQSMEASEQLACDLGFWIKF